MEYLNLPVWGACPGFLLSGDERTVPGPVPLQVLLPQGHHFSKTIPFSSSRNIPAWNVLFMSCVWMNRSCSGAHTQRRQRQAHRQPEWIPAICNLSTSSLLLTLQTAGINESFMRSPLLLACPRDVTGMQILCPQHPFIFSLNRYFLAHSPSACV